MYKGKQFRIKSNTELQAELQNESRCGRLNGVRRVFLADGNVTVLSTERLIETLQCLNHYLPNLRRVSSYVSSRDLLNKREEDLLALRAHKLTRLYCGIESGDNKILFQNNKGETPERSLDQLMKARNAGIDLSVMLLLGLGGRERTLEHARASAALLNRLQPYQLSLLVLGFPFGIKHYCAKLPLPFTPLTLSELISEMHLLVSELDLQRCHFRCDHASNFLPVQGVLSRDKANILSVMEQFSRSVPHSDRPYLSRIG